MNTLGAVYCRLGLWHEAAATLQASIRANRQGATYWDLYFLALSHHHLGEPAQARACFEQAVALHAQAERAADQTQLEALRVEVEAVLQITPARSERQTIH